MKSVTSEHVLSIAQEFTRTPGPRYRAEGSYSGEEFRESYLVQRYKLAASEGHTLLVDLDGGFGYATSFLEEAFGGLARSEGADRVLAVLKFKSDEEPYLIEEIQRYIRGAKK